MPSGPYQLIICSVKTHIKMQRKLFAKILESHLKNKLYVKLASKCDLVCLVCSLGKPSKDPESPFVSSPALSYLRHLSRQPVHHFSSTNNLSLSHALEFHTISLSLQLSEKHTHLSSIY